MNATDLGLIVREERQRRGLTQVDLSVSAGVSRRWLSALEAGKPGVEFGLVLKVAHALGLAVEFVPEPTPDIDLDDILNALGTNHGR